MENEKTVKKELRFLGKVILFCVPIAVLLGFPIFVMYRTGEFLSFSDMVARQTANPSLIVLTAYSNPAYYLNLEDALIQKPEVLVVGSSRTSEIRSDFFNATTTEYTASTMVAEMDQFQQYLDQIPDASSPKVLIIGLDQKFFNPNYDPLVYGPQNIVPLLTQAKNPAIDVLGNWWPHWFTIYGYLAKKKLTLGDLIHPSSSLAGIRTFIDGTGFRDDGSYAPGDQVFLTPSEDETYNDIQYGVRSFEYSDAVSQNLLNELDALLAECKARHIYVIGFVPPLSPVIYAETAGMGTQYGYFQKIAPAAAPIFQKYDFAFYDFTNPQSLGVSATDMKDGIHLTERGSMILIETMAKTNKTLAQYADPTRLQKILASTTAQVNVVSSY